MQYLRHFGVKKLIFRLIEYLGKSKIDYHAWFIEQKVTDEQLNEQRKMSWSREILISIVVPLYETPIPYLKEMIDSVRQQSYQNWELCLADASNDNKEIQDFINVYIESDSRIKYKKLNANYGISENTNQAIKLSSGEYIALLDHDDFLEHDALFQVMSVISKHQCDVLYTDEDKITEDGSLHFKPHFKSAFNMDLLRTNNYICHFLVFKKVLLDEVGGFRKKYDGAQDFDLIIRLCEKASNIQHIPRVLYHWRSNPGSTSTNPFAKTFAYDAGVHLLQEHYQRLKIHASVSPETYLGYYKTDYKTTNKPISVFIHHQSSLNHLKSCITSVERSSYNDCHIYVLCSRDRLNDNLIKLMQELGKRLPISYMVYDDNFIECLNTLIHKDANKYILLLSSRCKFGHCKDLTLMQGTCARSKDGIVGARFIRRGRLQNAGFTYYKKTIIPLFKNLNSSFYGYHCRAKVAQNVSLVSGDCMMFQRSLYEKLGGLNPKYSIHYWDFDFCLKALQYNCLVSLQSYINIKVQSSKRVKHNDKELFMKSWGTIISKEDKYFNENVLMISNQLKSL